MSELEKRIAALRHEESRAVPCPDPALRHRVMGAVDDELTRQERRASQREDETSFPWSWWWAAAAALIVLVINCSFMASADDGFSSRATPDQIARNIAALRAIEAQQEGMFK